MVKGLLSYDRTKHSLGAKDERQNLTVKIQGDIEVIEVVMIVVAEGMQLYVKVRGTIDPKRLNIASCKSPIILAFKRRKNIW